MIARYIAPVSRKAYPSRWANNLATVLFPAPDGPSIATTSVGTDALLLPGARFEESVRLVKLSLPVKLPLGQTSGLENRSRDPCRCLEMNPERPTPGASRGQPAENWGG